MELRIHNAGEVFFLSMQASSCCETSETHSSTKGELLAYAEIHSWVRKRKGQALVLVRNRNVPFGQNQPLICSLVSVSLCCLPVINFK